MKQRTSTEVLDRQGLHLKVQRIKATKNPIGRLYLGKDQWTKLCVKNGLPVGTISHKVKGVYYYNKHRVKMSNLQQAH